MDSGIKVAYSFDVGSSFVYQNEEFHCSVRLTASKECGRAYHTARNEDLRLLDYPTGRMPVVIVGPHCTFRQWSLQETVLQIRRPFLFLLFQICFKANSESVYKLSRFSTGPIWLILSVWWYSKKGGFWKYLKAYKFEIKDQNETCILNKKVYVKIHLPVSRETTILAVVECILSSICNGCQYH